ncbi:hypothetical protein H0W80_02790 [Candidatus Saccharibacteria bacterium]|nr:hypothetical protein [Candidatus Saccharibacteria bacterium]
MENITPDPNTMPDFDLGVVDRLKGIGRKLIGLCSYYPPESQLFHSDHYVKEHFDPAEERGAAAMLDRHLYEPTDGEAIVVNHQPELPFDAPTVTQLVAEAKQARTWGWTSMGEYTDQEEF